MPRSRRALWIKMCFRSGVIIRIVMRLETMTTRAMTLTTVACAHTMTAAGGGAGAWGIPCREDACGLGGGVTEGGREGEREGERAGGTGGGFSAAGLDAALDADVALGVMTSDGPERFVCVCAGSGSGGSSTVPSPNSISTTPAPCFPYCCSTVSVAACSTAAVASDVTTGKPHWARNMSTRSLASATLVAFATIRRISCTSEACVAGRLGMYLVETETEVELEFDRIGLGDVELGAIG